MAELYWTCILPQEEIKEMICPPMLLSRKGLKIGNDDVESTQKVKNSIIVDWPESFKFYVTHIIEKFEKIALP